MSLLALRPFRSVGGRLGLALAIVVTLALGIVYAIVVPSLERNLSQAKLDQLERHAVVLGARLPSFIEGDEPLEFELQDYAEQAAFVANARVVVYEVLTRAPEPRLRIVGDSRQSGSSGDIDEDPVALRASLSGGRDEGVVEREGQRYAEVAIPVAGTDVVVLFTSSLEDTLATVEHVQRRLLVAGAVGLAVALVFGYVGAAAFARRIRRLERAADRIAGGDLEAPVTDPGRDELGQLAEAFERMRRQLAQLEHARREFIANASHELRTPIFSLAGFLELLVGEELDAGTRNEFLRTMQEQVSRLEKLATDLLDLSRLDAGRLQLELDRLDLAPLAEALADEFAPMAQSSHHKLDVAAGSAAEALGDELRVLQIGRILVENALRHTPEGTPVVIRAGGDGGGAPALEVEDAGPGIPRDQAARVFERFYRVDGGRASGSGLGLAIARELAEAMGGRLELESRPGRTVFRLVLPVPARGRSAEPAFA